MPIGSVLPQGSIGFDIGDLRASVFAVEVKVRLEKMLERSQEDLAKHLRRMHPDDIGDLLDGLFGLAKEDLDWIGQLDVVKLFHELLSHERCQISHHEFNRFCQKLPNRVIERLGWAQIPNRLTRNNLSPGEINMEIVDGATVRRRGLDGAALKSWLDALGVDYCQIDSLHPAVQLPNGLIAQSIFSGQIFKDFEGKWWLISDLDSHATPVDFSFIRAGDFRFGAVVAGQ